MLARQQGEDVSDEAWAMTSFLMKVRIEKPAAPAPRIPTPASVDIFGSSGGVKGRTQSRGRNGFS